MEWRHRHVIDLDTWDRSDLQFIMEQSRSMDELLDRPIKKVPALRGKLVVNLFFEASTRTRVSFELAEKFLSADVVNWSASGSSTERERRSGTRHGPLRRWVPTRLLSDTGQ